MKLINNDEIYSRPGAAIAYTPTGSLLPAEEVVFNQLTQDLYILDAACGGGRTTFELLRRGFTHIEAFDNQEQLIALAKAHDPKRAELFRVCDMKNADHVYLGKKFDIILISFNGIDYVFPEEERLKIFKNMKNILKTKGKIIFSSHNPLCLSRSNLKILFKNLWRVITRNPYFITSQSYGALMTYYRTPSTIKKQLKDLGFRVEVTPNKKKFFPFRDPFPYYTAELL